MRLFSERVGFVEDPSIRHHHVIEIERVDKLTILGVLVNNNLTATDHVSTVLASCASLMHALRVLRGHGLSEQSLKDVFQATVVGKLLY